MDLGTVTGLFVYPVKGLAGISLREAEVEPEGLAQDRRWMVTDAAGLFLSQRKLPAMARLRPRLTETGLTLADAEGGEIEVGPPEPEPVPVTVWRSDVLAYPARKGVAEWIGERLGQPVHLVAMGERTVRPILTDAPDADGLLSFADGFPVLLASEASLASLNAETPTSLPMDRFRPNLVVSGGQAWAEDALGLIEVGAATFRSVKGCARCSVTTVDQTTGEKTGPEPLATLARVRHWDGKVWFGQNLIPTRLGTVRVGDRACYRSP